MTRVTYFAPPLELVLHAAAFGVRTSGDGLPTWIHHPGKRPRFFCLCGCRVELQSAPGFDCLAAQCLRCARVWWGWVRQFVGGTGVVPRSGAPPSPATVRHERRERMGL